MWSLRCQEWSLGGACANPEPIFASRVLPNGTIVEWLERGNEEDEKLRMLNKGPNGEVLSKEPRGRNYREERESMRQWAEIARAHEVPAFPNRPYRPPKLRYRIPEGRFPYFPKVWNEMCISG